VEQKQIVAIKVPYGSTKVKKEDIENEILQYFQNLLSEPEVNREEAISKITRAIPRLVNQRNHSLCYTWSPLKKWRRL
jgi:hypothetical protein